jgi:polyphosphate kinase 2 (PPK2 family)
MAENGLPDVTGLTGYKCPTEISSLDMDTKLGRKEYEAQIRQLQLDMVKMQQKVGDYGLRVILVFEGMDAAGKGGAIKRLIQHLDPRGYRVHSIGPPNQADSAQHYLRRFWMRLPKRGRISIFDDYSWYARMLLEPIEGYCTTVQHERAPRQVREFERTLVEENYILLKFWIQVSRQEQLHRFKKRLNNPYKAWKLTPEDWRNREMYGTYIEHAQQMINETHMAYAPWFLVPGDDKLFARTTVLRVVTEVTESWPVDPVPYSVRFDHLHWLEEHGDAPVDD